MQESTCDDVNVYLSCPGNTTINIQVAKYEQASADNLCMTENTDRENCVWPNEMQYSLLQKVIVACQKKPYCGFNTKPGPNLTDPCPLSKKFVEIAYKCRPSVFRSEIKCNNEVMSLTCDPPLRVVILDAQYGRIFHTTDSDVNCPVQNGLTQESCSMDSRVEVMKTCHGKKSCSVLIKGETFGFPCRTNLKPYMKISYACVPAGLLIDKYQDSSVHTQLNINTLSDPVTEQEEAENNELKPVTAETSSSNS